LRAVAWPIWPLPPRISAVFMGWRVGGLGSLGANLTRLPRRWQDAQSC
jgi:hypothetical protein